MTDFEKAVNFVLDHEGYKSELPGDPGGLTIWGVSMRSHPDEVKAMLDMTKANSREYAKEVYRIDYWNPTGCSRMSWPLNLVVFDTAVNCGIARANRFMAGADWQKNLCNRTQWLIHESKSRYLNGLLNRVLSVFEMAQN